MEVFRQKLKHAMAKTPLRDLNLERQEEINLLDVNIEEGENDAML